MPSSPVQERRTFDPSTVLAYGIPLALGGLLCALTLPSQLDRIAEDEARDTLRAFALATGESGFWDAWSELHPPFIPAIQALLLAFLPAPIALRAPALLVGLLTIPLVVCFGRRTGRPEVGLVAGLLVAACPIWWVYSCSLSLDLVLAGFTTLAAFACIPRFNLWLAIVALVGAGLTKRMGLPLVGTAMLLATVFRGGTLRSGKVTPFLGAGVICVLMAVAAWRYEAGGGTLFGSFAWLRDFTTSSPTLLLFGVPVLALAVFTHLRAPRAQRAMLQQLLLFIVPFVIAPLMAVYPSPRYVLPAFPVAAVVGAAHLWLFAPLGGGERTAARWALSIAFVATIAGLQMFDLRNTYWPNNRGHRAAVAWLATQTPAPAVVLSPDGPFLEAACMQEGVELEEIVAVDRWTCGDLEGRLAGARRPAWVVLPLYRRLGWSADLEQHAADMGLELRAFVRRNVVVGGAVPWESAEVEAIDDSTGAPILAILSVEGKLDRNRLNANATAFSLARFTADGLPRGWTAEGVAVEPAEGSGASVKFAEIDGTISADWLRTASTRAAVAWHHHGWLELQVRATDEALASVRLSIGFRRSSLDSRLSDLPAVGDSLGWRRLLVDLGPWPSTESSRVTSLQLKSWHPGTPDFEPTIELREMRVLPSGAVELPDPPTAHDIAKTRHQLAWKARVRSASVERFRERWDEARAAISTADGKVASVLYRKHPIELMPMEGLVPIGMNPDTGLWEFYHLRSAWDPESGLDPADLPIPAHGAAGSIEMTGDTGIVLVLVPGGSFMMGRNDDHPDAQDEPASWRTRAHPCHEITLVPFFLARHELTQGQWARLSGGEDPSHYPLGYSTDGSAAPVTWAHPVEQVSWTMCRDLFDDHGLALPTEAQWEYSCRAGSTTAWYPGDAIADLEGFANVLDQTANETLSGPSAAFAAPFFDGFGIHSPVGSFRPNRWGLFDMHGNVSEWCEDWFGEYDLPVADGDAQRLVEGASYRIVRGGTFAHRAISGESARRGSTAEPVRYQCLGVRAAMSVPKSF